MIGPWCPSGTPYPELDLHRKKIFRIKQEGIEGKQPNQKKKRKKKEFYKIFLKYKVKSGDGLTT
jgi:hypothetical protein